MQDELTATVTKPDDVWMIRGIDEGKTTKLITMIGGSAYTESVVYVNKRPVVTICYPKSVYEAIVGETLNIFVEAKDEDGEVDILEIYANDQLIWSNTEKGIANPSEALLSYTVTENDGATIIISVHATDNDNDSDVAPSDDPFGEIQVNPLKLRPIDGLSAIMLPSAKAGIPARYTIVNVVVGNVIVYNPYGDISNNSGFFYGQLHIHWKMHEDHIYRYPDLRAKQYKDLGYDFIAITQHDHIAATPQDQGILVLAGEEWSPQFYNSKMYHVLALGIDPLRGAPENIKTKLLVERSKWIKTNEEEYLANNQSRWDMSNNSTGESVKEFLKGEHDPTTFNIEYPGNIESSINQIITDVIQVIHHQGGLAFVPHPLLESCDMDKFKNVGCDAISLYTAKSSHKGAWLNELYRFCEYGRFNLLPFTYADDDVEPENPARYDDERIGRDDTVTPGKTGIMIMLSEGITLKAGNYSAKGRDSALWALKEGHYWTFTGFHGTRTSIPRFMIYNDTEQQAIRVIEVPGSNGYVPPKINSFKFYEKYKNNNEIEADPEHINIENTELGEREYRFIYHNHLFHGIDNSLQYIRIEIDSETGSLYSNAIAFQVTKSGNNHSLRAPSENFYQLIDSGDELLLTPMAAADYPDSLPENGFLYQMYQVSSLTGTVSARCCLNPVIGQLR